MTEPAFIALGSNIDPEVNLPLAGERLRALGTPSAISQVYQNPAIGRPDQPDYLNAAALVETDLEAAELRERLRRIEDDLGRVRQADRYAARTIDLDLCLLGRRCIEGGRLMIPDPDILTRPVLARTLAELAPYFRHPITGQTLQAIADALPLSRPTAIRSEVAQALAQALGLEGIGPAQAIG